MDEFTQLSLITLIAMSNYDCLRSILGMKELGCPGSEGRPFLGGARKDDGLPGPEILLQESLVWECLKGNPRDTAGAGHWPDVATDFFCSQHLFRGRQVSPMYQV